MPSNTPEQYSSLLWITIPPFVLLSAYYVRQWYLARRLRLHGIGKGAPGFQTGIRRVRVTPEIAARIRRGEDVSPEEIEAASRKADQEEEAQRQSGSSSSANANTSGGMPRGVIEERDDRHLLNAGGSRPTEATKVEETEVNEWLPESITKPTKRKKGRR
ncbi:hypothetical protein NLJ89_g9046 [Agrocybe chaxingu]|uniref:Uncharacterized protein n=1 Tax=Agrocybe chaxingu TaxID=84603 RepID=A0A9W8JTT3_9AGAR|nr:hypothetical protein NLJ89_g9046 [Agrocybe chaxingu]